MKSLFGGSAVIAATLLLSSLILSATPSAAETPLAPSQPQKQEPAKSQIQTGSVVEEKATDSKAVASTPSTIGGLVTEKTNPGTGLASPGIGAASMAPPVTAQANYSATAYSLNGRTASGRPVTKGLIAADPRVLPLGSRVRLEAGSYSGEYTVADTGGAIRGKKIDIWTPSSREANRFGRRTVKLVVLSYGPKRSAVPRPRKHSARR
jgi:3D (Asp-Asp-Asp) domain-containing protein